MNKALLVLSDGVVFEGKCEMIRGDAKKTDRDADENGAARETLKEEAAQA